MEGQFSDDGENYSVRSYSVFIAWTVEKSATCGQRPKVDIWNEYINHDCYKKKLFPFCPLAQVEEDFWQDPWPA